MRWTTLLMAALISATLPARDAASAAMPAPAPSPVRERPLSAHFPPETAIYIEAPSLPAIVTGIKSTGLYALWNDPAFAALRAKATGATGATETTGNSGASGAAALVGTSGFAKAAADLAATARGAAAFGLILGPDGATEWLIVAQVDPDAAETKAFVAQLSGVAAGTGSAEPASTASDVSPAASTDSKLSPPAPVAPVAPVSPASPVADCVISGDLLFIGSTGAIARAGRTQGLSGRLTLSSAPHYARASALFSAAPAYKAVLDYPALMARLKSYVPREMDDELARVLASAGLDGIDGVALEGRFALSGVSEHVYVWTRSGDAKLAGLIGSGAFDESRLSVVPRDAFYFAGRANDFASSYTATLDIQDALTAPAGVNFTKALASLEKRGGVVIKRDLIPALGSASIEYVTIPSAPVFSANARPAGISQVRLIEIKDEAAARKAIDRIIASIEGDPVILADLAPMPAASRPGLPGRPARPVKPAATARRAGRGAPSARAAARPVSSGARVETLELGDVRVHYVSIPGRPSFSPAVCIYGGYLIYATDKSAVKAVIDRLIAPGGSIVDNPDYARTRGVLPARTAWLSYLNLDGVIDMAYSLAPAALGQARSGGTPRLRPADLPSAFAVKRHIDGIGASVTLHDNVIDAQVYSPTGIAPLVAMAVGVPVLASRRAAERADENGPAAASNGGSSRERLLAMGRLLQISTIQRQGRFPDRLSDAAPQDMLRAPNGAGTGATGATGEGEGDYIYVPGNTTSSPGSRVLVYERGGLTEGGRNVLFVDGRVEFVEDDAFNATIGAGK